MYPKTPGPDSELTVGWWDFESLDASGLLWADRSRNGLHATPQAGFAAPNFGLGRSTRGKGFCSFTGAANRYGTLPLRFYQVAPTATYTLIAVYKNNNTAAGVMFGCDNAGGGGVWKGMIDYILTTGAINHYHLQGGAALPLVSTPTGLLVPPRTRVSILSVAATPFSWCDGVQGTATWAVGAYGAIVYDTTVVPQIGAHAGGERINSDLFFLALFRDWVPSHQEAVSLSRTARDWV